LDLVLPRVPARPSRWHSYQSLPWVFLIGELQRRVTAGGRRDDPPLGEVNYWIAATAD
jgi:hypothetical protein